MAEKKENRVKLYGIILGLVTLALQHGIYLLANELAGVVGNPSIYPKIVEIDDKIPLVAVFILPYVWAYAFWGMAPMAASKCKLDHFLNHLATYLFACVIGAIVLTFVPTYMDRAAEGILTEGGNFLDKLRLFWYSLDGGEMAYNLFPSFHCINSTVAWLAVFGRKEVPLWYRIYSFVLAALICVSTLFVKQHFIIDVFSGIAIALLAYVFCERFNAGRMFLKPIALCKKLFTKKEVSQ